MRVALYFVITLFGSIGLNGGHWDEDVVSWGLNWFVGDCDFSVIIWSGGWWCCVVVSFFWWLVRGCGVVIMVLNWNCRGCDWGIGRSWGVGFVWSWFVISCLIVISWGAFVWCVFCGQESVVILNDSWDLGDLHCCVDQSYEVIIVEWLWFLILELVL